MSMFGLIKKKYPDFWNEYASQFNKKKGKFQDIRFVVFDTETTGLNPKKDAILSIGAIAVTNRQIAIKDSFETYIDSEYFTRKTVQIHGIRKSGINKKNESVCIQNFLLYIKDAVLVGHHVAFDVAMINSSLKKIGLPKLKNKTIETGDLYLKSKITKENKTHFSLDEVAKTLSIALHDRHNAAGDAYITAQVFVKLLKKIQKNNTLSIPFLKRPYKKQSLF